MSTSSLQIKLTYTILSTKDPLSSYIDYKNIMQFDVFFADDPCCCVHPYIWFPTS